MYVDSEFPMRTEYSSTGCDITPGHQIQFVVVEPVRTSQYPVPAFISVVNTNTARLDHGRVGPELQPPLVGLCCHRGILPGSLGGNLKDISNIRSLS